MGSSRSEMQCPEFESPMDHQKECIPGRVCTLFSDTWGTHARNIPKCPATNEARCPKEGIPRAARAVAR